MKKIIYKIEGYFISVLSYINVTLASKYLFLRSQKYKLNLKNPKTFNEKLMWLKLNIYNKNSDVWNCSDKYLVREYALKNGVSKCNLPEIIKVYSNADEIDFNELPKKFALKCTHGCGFNVICTNKDNIDEKKTKKQLNKWLKTKFGYKTAEVHYTKKKPRIICEKYMDNNNQLPNDYKLYCFNGIPKIVLVCSERSKKLKLNFYDLKWNELNLGIENNRNKNKIAKPKKLNEMIEIAKKVSKDFPFVRVDFYEFDGVAVLGELTFTPAACTANYYNKEGNEYLGSLLELNIESNNG